MYTCTGKLKVDTGRPFRSLFKGSGKIRKQKKDELEREY